ncbi:MAG: hypothetical protein KC978_20415, partial [Candidatus Omnitrophica bacterium]|nr:hypothetical protein [Candidatus Omnitrophota bacterium]
MPTILDSYYGTSQSYLKQEHVHLLRYNDRLLERLNAVEAYHSLPLSKWHSLAGKPTEHGIPHYMITSDQGDEYIRDRVDYIRSEAGVPAFPWFSVPASNQYWGRS